MQCAFHLLFVLSFETILNFTCITCQSQTLYSNVNKEGACAQTRPLSNKLSGPLLEAGFFFRGALNTLSIYNKSSEALQAEPRHAPEEALSQGDYLRHLKAALT